MSSDTCLVSLSKRAPLLGFIALAPRKSEQTSDGAVTSWSTSRSKLAPPPSIFFPVIAFLCWSLCVPSWLLAAEKTAVLFQELCSVCHGVEGKGDGPSARGIEPKPADFTNCTAMAKDSDEVLLKIIKGGGQSVGRSTVMPAWGESLSERQISELVKFIRGLCKKQNRNH